MKTLPETFRKHGDEFRQIKRECDIAIYLRSSPSGPKWFEVILVQSHNGREIGGNQVQASEFYPSTSSWGRLGWTYQGADMDGALAKFSNLKDQSR